MYSHSVWRACLRAGLSGNGLFFAQDSSNRWGVIALNPGRPFAESVWPLSWCRTTSKTNIGAESTPKNFEKTETEWILVTRSQAHVILSARVGDCLDFQTFRGLFRVYLDRFSYHKYIHLSLAGIERFGNEKSLSRRGNVTHSDKTLA